MLTGQNGILNRDQEAKEKTETAQEDETQKLQGYEDIIKQYSGNLPIREETKPYFPSDAFYYKEGDFNTGLVIEEKATGSQYVWVEVPKTVAVYPTAGVNITSFTDGEYIKIEADLHTYTADYRNETSYNDVYYDDDSDGWFTETTYNVAKKKMLKSVYQNGGFWVGRYEAGTEKNRISSNDATTIPLTKANLYPYTYVTRTQAKVLAEQVESGSYTSSLLFGVQWDLVLKYIETKTVDSAEESNKNAVRTQIIKDLNNNSTNNGNYYDSEILLSRGKFAQYNALSNWYEYNSIEKTNLVIKSKKIEQNLSSNGILLTTGATENAKFQNIYDIAGNVWEWTLEKTYGDSVPCANRGGGYGSQGSSSPASYRSGNVTSGNGDYLGFRVGIWK